MNIKVRSKSEKIKKTDFKNAQQPEWNEKSKQKSYHLENKRIHTLDFYD